MLKMDKDNYKEVAEKLLISIGMLNTEPCKINTIKKPTFLKPLENKSIGINLSNKG